MEKNFKIKLKSPPSSEVTTQEGLEIKHIIIKAKNKLTEDDLSDLNIGARRWHGQELEDSSKDNQDKVSEAIDKMESLPLELVDYDNDNHRKFCVMAKLDTTKSYRFTAKYRGQHILCSPILYQSPLVTGESHGNVTKETMKLENLVDPRLVAARASLSSESSITIKDLNSNFSKLSLNERQGFTKTNERPQSSQRGHMDIPPTSTAKKPRLVNESHTSPIPSNSSVRKPIDFCRVKEWRRVFTIENNKNGTRPCEVDSPIGICILHGSKLVIASTFENKIKMFDKDTGNFMMEVRCREGQFDRPSDMVALPSGGFAVRDRTRVMVFDNNGQFVENIMEDSYKFGLTVNDDGMLVCLESRSRGTRLRFIKYDSSVTADIQQTDDINISEIFAGMTHSRCRFLTYRDRKYFITDLGLNKVYILAENDDPIVKFDIYQFGSSGAGPGQFDDPAGVVVDSHGNMIVADSRNHRLCLYDSNRKFIRVVKTCPEVYRPSALYLCEDNIYVLGLGRRFGVMKLKPCL